MDQVIITDINMETFLPLGIKPEEVIPYYVAQTALKREIKGQDIADSIVFLCSDKARTITGQTLVADAGQVMVR